MRTFLAATLLTLLAASPALAQNEGGDDYPGNSHYLRTAYQYGAVVQTNDFLEGDNATGEPIDRFQSLRLDFGWQTDGSKDWHHLFNFPTFGIGLYGADFYDENELGTPSSLYGFFTWPLVRWDRWRFNFDIAFGFTNNWAPYDPENNPYNSAIGLARSVHIEGGPNLEFRFAKRWSVIGGFTFTHFSNGGTQLPNNGLNTVAPILFAKFDTDTPVPAPARRDVGDYDHSWDLTVTGSGGKRNLDLQFDDPDMKEEYANQSYFIGNLTVGLGRKFSHKSRYVFGLDVGYDESVQDLEKVDAYNNGRNVETSSGDNWELAVFGGYEIMAHRTRAIIHFGYKLFYKDVEGRLPVFYQRLGVQQYVYRDLFVGMNVRFHELGSADNLEWNLGYRMKI